jgi:hypothetical protein
MHQLSFDQRPAILAAEALAQRVQAAFGSAAVGFAAELGPAKPAKRDQQPRRS